MKTIIRKCLLRLCGQLGLFTIPRWRLDSYFLAARIRRIIDFYKIDCVIDVGANLGQYRDFLRGHVEFGGLIVSFEPDPDLYAALLEKSKADPLWRVVNLALGSSSGVLEFNRMKSSVFNSFLEPDQLATKHFSDEPLVVNSIRIPTQRLDQVLDQLGVTSERLFLKMDTQGFDLEVFRGASGCLGKIRAIQTELAMRPLYKGAPDYSASIPEICAKGYEVSGLYPLTENRFPEAIEFDCLFTSRPS